VKTRKRASLRGVFAPGGLLSLVSYLALAGSCGTSSTPYDEVGQWSCFEEGDRCDCFGRPEGARVDDEREPTPGCAPALDCCFVKDVSDGKYDCTCIATPPDEADSGAAGAAGGGGEGGMHTERSPKARCALAAAEQNSTEVVAHCPPLTLNAAGICALTFESCEDAYLKANGLVACCDDLVCKADSTGQKICSVAN
jgi:hypothetical protein